MRENIKENLMVLMMSMNEKGDKIVKMVLLSPHEADHLYKKEAVSYTHLTLPTKA